MPDLTEFRKESEVQRTPCSVSTLLDKLEASEPERAAKLSAALDDQAITSAAIERVVTGWGYSVKAATYGRHRKGACSCDD